MMSMLAQQPVSNLQGRAKRSAVRSASCMVVALPQEPVAHLLGPARHPLVS